MLTNRGEKWPKWGTNQLRERSGSQTNAIANLASSNASVDYRNRGHSQATETNLSNHLFYRKKLFSAIGKCREILVTVHNTTGSIYTTTQRHEGLPACRESKWRRSKGVSDCLEHHIHQHQFIRPSNAIRALFFQLRSAQNFPRHE